jgi:hypothetical protein
MTGNESKDLGRRTFGTVGWETSRESPARLGEVIVLPVARAWKPRAGSIYNFPVRRVVEEK